MPTDTGHIIAMGGGGFSMDPPENRLMDDYVLAQARRAQPRVCFLGTASGDSSRYIERFYAAFSQRSCDPTHINLFDTPPPDVGAIVAKQDVFYVGGGSTRNLIVLWREWGLDWMLSRAWRNGAVMCGVSAGSLCWFQCGVSDSYSIDLKPVQCLGWLEGSNCPHYDGEVKRRPAYHAMVKAGELPAGYAADDGAALHYVGDTLHRAVSSRPNAKVYRVSFEHGSVVENAIETHYLGAT